MQYLKEMDTNEQSRDSEENEPSLEELVDAVNDEDLTQQNSTLRAGSGVRMYKINDEIVFLSQVQSYIHRGSLFKDFNPLEFECIVDLKIKDEEEAKSRGRTKRKGFPLGEHHPLFNTHRAYIRTKMHTAIFGGPAPPNWTHSEENVTKRTRAAQYLISTFTPWHDGKPSWDYNDKGLIDLLKTWDKSSGPLIDKGRVRYMRNMMKKGFRSSTNEEICTDWRNRTAEFWNENTKKPLRGSNNRTSTDTIDPELSGTLPSGNLYELLIKAYQQNSERREDVISMQELILHNIPEDFATNGRSELVDQTEVIFGGTSNRSDSNPISLRQISRSIKNYKRVEEEAIIDRNGRMEVYDPLASVVTEFSPIRNFSPRQTEVFDYIFENIANNKQTLTIVHGGGGTGKSYLVGCIGAELNRRRFQMVSTCPTGAGACQLPQGRTFHSAFKVNSKDLSTATMASLKQLFNDRVRLIVIDEMSMLQAQFVSLLNNRLRMLYDSNKDFGGMSILMVSPNV
jgi:hypothetical protein